MKVCVFIDGFNLFHAIDGNRDFHKYKWLDLRKLARSFVTTQDQVSDVYYFSAYAIWDSRKVDRHKIYIEALKSVGVKIVLGAFRLKDVHCFKCRKTSQTYAEKETDVNIAIKLFQVAIRGDYEKAIIVSGDSDLIPAIKAVKETFPTKRIQVAIPIGRRADLLKQEADSHMKIKEIHLASCQFPEKITLPSGIVISRPPTWK